MFSISFLNYHEAENADEKKEEEKEADMDKEQLIRDCFLGKESFLFVGQELEQTPFKL